MMQYDSRKIQSGDTFICLPGGDPYIDDAISRGASKVLKMTRAEMAVLAAEQFDNPSAQLTVIGVTGTNGKTTITYLVHHCLGALDQKSALVGTLNSELTTPESLDLQHMMASHLKSGGTHFVMEASSHGIAQNRLDQIQFSIKCLTPITQDHLDYHGTLEAYRQVKLGFMSDFPGESLYVEEYADVPIPTNPYLVGGFNQQNLKAVKAILRRCGFSDAQIDPVIAVQTPPPGRFERIDLGQPYTVIVDFAHTPDGLKNILDAAQALRSPEGAGRILTLFGCGGDRDRAKRPLMAQAAARQSDYVVITHDNPRTESRDQIISDILNGLPQNGPPHTVIEDRKQAIEAIISEACDGDIVLITGKGHETKQILAHGAIHLDDREEARHAIQKKQRI